MAATVLQLNSRMKKKIKRRHPIRESEVPVDLNFMREFRVEIMQRFEAHEHHFKKIYKLFEAMDAKIEGVRNELKSEIHEVKSEVHELKADMHHMKSDMHQVKVLCEEQNLRNKQAYDGYFVTYSALEDLRSNLKPECFKD